MTKILKSLQRVARWFFGAPFEELPPEFGDPVPPDLRRFEDQAAAVQHQPQGRLRVSSSGPRTHTKPVQVDEFLEREK